MASVRSAGSLWAQAGEARASGPWGRCCRLFPTEWTRSLAWGGCEALGRGDSGGTRAPCQAYRRPSCSRRPLPECEAEVARARAQRRQQATGKGSPASGRKGLAV